jgi:hypothetical protein
MLEVIRRGTNVAVLFAYQVESVRRFDNHPIVGQKLNTEFRRNLAVGIQTVVRTNIPIAAM